MRTMRATDSRATRQCASSLQVELKTESIVHFDTRALYRGSLRSRRRMVSSWRGGDPHENHHQFSRPRLRSFLQTNHHLKFIEHQHSSSQTAQADDMAMIHWLER